MKHVVVTSELQEAEIRPPTLLSEFKRLSVRDAQKFFGDVTKLVEVANPSTGSRDSRLAFEKDGFRYHLAHDCGSLFVSPRPTQAALAEYYRRSEASAYRVQHYARETAEARRLHLLRSHANWMGRLFDEHGTTASRAYVDVGTNSPAIFEEVARLGLFDRLYSFNPLPGLEEECALRGVEILREPLRNAGVVTAFQQMENQFSPLELVKTASDMLDVGGMFFLTTRTISGFDLQVLWDKTPYIFVPEHLNLLSIEGLNRLLERGGLDTVELSTPGQLDVELVMHAARNDPSIELPRFIRYLLNERDRHAHRDFQEFLQKHRLSSHVRVAASRREGVAT
jgi:hypothetical protein